MATADVVVAGAGLAGLTAAVRLADAGARVEVVARGHAATHWGTGGFDVAAPAGSRTSRDGIAALAGRRGHPYATVAGDVGPGLGFVRDVLAAEGLLYGGGLEDPLRAVPTAIGGSRPAGIVPAAQAVALAPWAPDERLVVVGIAGFKDFWPGAIAASLARPAVWAAGGGDGPGGRPARVDGLVVRLPGLTGRRNLSALEIARLFDEPAWRDEAFGVIARAVERLAMPKVGRIALPAVLGLTDHPAALAAGERLLPAPFLEVPLVPPSVPGLRLYAALRAAFRRRGGRLVVGEAITRVETSGRRVASVAASAAIRERPIRTGGLVLATGGIAGGGLVGRPDGTLEEPLLGLPVEAPPPDSWLGDEPFEPAGHPLEAAGIRTDDRLRPVDPRGRPVFDNVAIVGSQLAGQRYLVERCGDGVAIASGIRAAALFGGGETEAAPTSSAAETGSRS